MEKLSLKQLRDDFDALINTMEIDQAGDLLLNAQFNNVSDERERQLLLAKVYILKGTFNLAQESLDDFRHLGGDSERLLLEQLNLHYLAGNFSSWNTAISRSLYHLKIEKNIRFLNLTVNEQIGLLKHFEEAGLIAEVIEAYEFLATQNLENWEHIKVNSQLLRLYSLWSIKGPLSSLYQSLLHLSESEIHKDFYIEVQHGLLLAELVLFGNGFADIRLEKLMSMKLDVFDKKLILVDYIELFVQVQKRPPTIPWNRLNQASLDFYEQQVLNILSGTFTVMSLNYSDLCSAGFFRLLSMANNLKLNISDTTIQQCLFLLEQYSPKSKKLWLSRLDLSRREPSDMEVLFKNETLIYNSKSVSLVKQPILGKIIQMVTDTPDSVSIETLVTNLFNEEADLKNQDRIRVNIARLNRIFENKLGIPKPFKINNGFLICNVKLQAQK